MREKTTIEACRRDLAEKARVFRDEFLAVFRPLLNPLLEKIEKNARKRWLNKILTEEDIEFLRDLGNELKTQDTLSTAKPIFWQINEVVKRYCIDPAYADRDCVLIGEDGGTHCDTEDEAKKLLVEDYDIAKEDLVDIDSLEEIEDYCDDKGIPCHYTGYEEYEARSGCFLTLRAVHAHIQRNGYRYAQGRNTGKYCNHAFRNPELEKLLKIVEKFSPEK